MKNKMTNIETLRNEIYTVLRKEIGERDYCLLDLPNYYNPGDQLIWEGDVQFARRLQGNLKYCASLHFFNPQMVLVGDCILLQGGGSFGDLYYKHQKFREYIVKKFPRNKIIILPSTIHFSEVKNLQKSAELFSQHLDLIICARDNKSFRILQENFLNNKCYLAPDTAFAIENIEKAHSNMHHGKVLFLCRTDKESKNLIKRNSLDFIENLEISDWPTQKIVKIFLHLLILNTNRVLLKVYKLFGSHWNKRNDVYGLIKLHSKERQIRSAVEFLSQYDLIITTRLHGHILACLLGVPNIVLDNSYGKNKNFYDTWMRDNSFNAYYADSLAEVRRILIKNFPNIRYKQLLPCN